MADLSKYREVKHVIDHSETVSDMLTNQGWEIISAKIVETQHRVHPGMGQKEYIEKRGEAHYIIGLPRAYKTPEEREESRRLREMVDR